MQFLYLNILEIIEFATKNRNSFVYTKTIFKTNQ